MRIKAVLTLVLWLCAFVPAYAQPPSPESAYAPLIEAAKSLSQNKLLAAASMKTATLSEKRSALFDSAVNGAIVNTRKWLDSPPDLSAPLALGGDISMFGGARDVGRAFAIQIYVQFADGKTASAIDSARYGLRLAYALESHSLIGWMTGTAIEATIMNAVAERLNQLSEPDCKRMLKLAEDWAKTANLLEVALERERLAGLAQLKTQFGQNAETWKAVEQGVTTAYQRIYEQRKQPYWERTELTAPDAPKEVGEALAAMLRPVFQSVAERPVRRLALARLLGCHAAIRAFRWENRHLPASLSELNIGDMAIDPFTGQEFTYKVKMDKFTLESVGGYARDENGVANKEKRVPVALAP